MGYYTRFRLETDADTQALIEEWADSEDEQNGYVQYCLIDQQESKWYDHKKDIEAFSLLHPTVTFTLMGEGEESGDIWRLVVRDGTSVYQKAKIVFEPLRA